MFSLKVVDRLALLSLLAATLAIPLAATAYADGLSLAANDAARGKAVYESLCSGCHSPDENRYGPAHRGVFGRKAGSATGYGYSSALASSTVVWSDESLDRWLADPEKLIPGQKMRVSFASAAERHDVIAYLKSLAPQ